MSHPYDESRSHARPAHPYVPQQPAGYGPPSGYGGMPGPIPPRPARNGLGITALVLGIIGPLTGLIPIFFWMAGTLGLLAVIFGFVGRARAGRGEATNGGMALTGALLGLVAMGVATWGLIVTITAVNDTINEIDKAVTSARADFEQGPADASEPTKSPAKKPIALGQVAREAPFALKVLSVSRKSVVSSSIENLKAKGSFVVVRVLVKNTSKSPATFDGSDSGLLDSDSKQYVWDSNATINQNLTSGEGLYDPINPGAKVTRTIVFDLPAKSTPMVIALFGSTGSDGAFMYLR
ncbi:DUF4190 and DUF4352 domain-containing protein [Nonomuraea sp. NN258]|uniref:DUF4190 domain-containing protein n=1 Tax=Nonomuraea antri TaxID=2730852 RepID=UPI001569632C|nr:DUF4190 domain-containing protein [Nonomuraea antri]NRQ40821.1 DUF4190 and DUF4352 domain-containing protein [Nonomuraea antri]